jgi:phosphoribosylformylglycinamidine cyclo-ligase
VLVALESSGLHTNGFSLARRIVTERMGLAASDRFPGDARSVADVLLAVHRSYLQSLRPVLGRVHAMAHITGGGIPGNLDRALPPSLDAAVDTSTWAIPNLFRQLAAAGRVERDEMFRAFNMGVGMVVIGPDAAASDVIAAAAQCGVKGWRAGEVRPGSGRVILNEGVSG